jgi:hypothetical protein
MIMVRDELVVMRDALDRMLVENRGPRLNQNRPYLSFPNVFNGLFRRITFLKTKSKVAGGFRWAISAVIRAVGPAPVCVYLYSF